MDKVFMFEVPVNNIKRASGFYKTMFGWKIMNWDGFYWLTTVPEDKNWVPKEKGAINGEMYRRSKKDEKPVLVVMVPSIARALNKLKKAGGKIISEKEQFGEWGYYARIKDTEGNIFALWEEMK